MRRFNFRNILFVLLLAGCVQFVNSCAVNPVTGERELNLLSESQEIQLGKEADPQIIAQYGLYNDPKISEFIDKMGQRMAGISHRPTLEFHFRVLDSPVVNAFALPGGYVYFTRGILGYMNSEAEVAGVLGHEIGHVTARHGAKAYTRQQLAQVGLAAGYIFSETFRQFSDLAQASIGLLFLKFSRDQESQSDKLGVEYSTKIGYDARDMSEFFGTLERLSEAHGSSLPTWQSTHPDPADREKRTLELAVAEQQAVPGTNFKTNRDAFLNLIDGVIYGDDPRQGFVENDVFYHPELEFQFPVPSNWLLQNTPQVVQMANKEQTAGMQFTLAQESTPQAAAEKFVAGTGGTVNDSRSKRVNGYATEVRLTTIATEQGNLVVLSYFIEKDGHIYVFHGFSGEANFNNFRNTFTATMEGFDRLRNQAAKSVKPTRVNVVKVNKSGTLQEILADYPTNEATPEELAIVNGMKLSDRLKAGDRIKVLTK